MKRFSADGSVGLPHVRVGHRQALNREPRANARGFFMPEKQRRYWLIVRCAVRAFGYGSLFENEQCAARTNSERSECTKYEQRITINE